MILRYAGAVLIILLAGCSASHTANPISVIPGAPNFTPQGGVDPFNLNKKNIIHTYPANAPYYMATGSDKNVWFTEANAARIGKITPSGAVTEYAILSGSFGNEIAAGPSGQLWFTENNGNTVGKITTAGHVTEFTLPASESATQGIAKGPDGNMWFTDYNTNSIGKITPTGVVTEYLIATPSAMPWDIAAGPDGNLWFAEAGGTSNSIGKITTSGTITEFPGPYCGEAIVAGPDGNLYAASPDERICQITTAGVITAFASFAAGGLGMVLGPDKQIWMTGCAGQPYFCEFNPKTHVFSAIISSPDPTHLPIGIVVGGDGDLWIAGGGANNIFVYEEKVTTIGIRLNGELSFTDPNYGFELGYAVGTSSIQTQTISLSMGESVQFKNVDTVPHSAAFLGNATANSALWPGSFNGSTTKSPAGTSIGTAGWATGSLNPNKTSPIYETGLPGFYMIGCQYHYNTNEMRTVIVVH